MAEPSRVEDVKLFVAILYADLQALSDAETRLRDVWGPIDFEGPEHPFDMSDYYGSEMGADLKRRLVSFERLVPPETLTQAKLTTNSIESALSVSGRRRVNLDVGYLDHNKVVLGSVKYAGQKIHLGKGIYADLIARFGHGRYRPFEWTFPDFRDGRYDTELNRLRQIYLQQRKRQA